MGIAEYAMAKKLTRQPNYALRFALLLAGFLLILFVSFFLGQYEMTAGDVCKIFFSRIFSIEKTWDDSAERILFLYRAPRALAAALIGGALALAGVSYQGMFSNPMVSPDVLGASTGAGFGAALAILLGCTGSAVSAAAFVFGLLAVFLAYVISRKSRTNPTLAMILAGMMISSLFSAGTSFLKLVADVDSQLPAITYWLMGSLSDIRQADLLPLCIPLLLGAVPLFLLRWRINLLTVGEEEASAMGINTKALRLTVVICATLLTAASVSVSGMIGWVGLVIPHFCRLLFGCDYRRLVPASVLFGGAFLMLVDNISRTVTTAGIPLGILTSFVGAPVFLYLILTGGGRRDP